QGYLTTTTDCGNLIPVFVTEAGGNGDYGSGNACQPENRRCGLWVEDTSSTKKGDHYAWRLDRGLHHSLRNSLPQILARQQNPLPQRYRRSTSCANLGRNSGF